MITNSDSAARPFQLAREDIAGLQAYLVERGFAQDGETVTAELAGEGNMNCVVRVRLPNRNLILKQARPWVEKYPSIAAPVERAASEARFYRFAARNPLVAAMMPRLLDFDDKSALLVMEDLFAAEPLIDCYEGSRRFNQRQLKELAKYTSALHSLAVPVNEREGFRNTAMRRLNHEHIFDLPLRRDGVLSEMLERITPGLDHVADDLRQDSKYCDTVRSLGERYLATERTEPDSRGFVSRQSAADRFRTSYGSSIRNSAFVETLNSTSVSSMRICCFPNMARTPSPGGCKSLWKIRSTPIL